MKKRSRSGSPFSLFAFQDIITSVCGIVVMITLLLTLQLSVRMATTEAEPSPFENDCQELRAKIEEAELALLEAKEALKKDQRELRSIPKELQNTTIEEMNEKIESVRARIEDLKNSTAENAKILENAKEELMEKRNKDAEKDREIQEIWRQITKLQEDLERYTKEAKKSQKRGNVIFKSDNKDHRKPYLVDVSDERIRVDLISNQERDHQEFSDVTSFIDWAKKKDENKYYYVVAMRPSGMWRGRLIRVLLDEGGFRIGLDFLSEDQTVQIE